MTSIHKLKKDIAELKNKQRPERPLLAFEVFDAYTAGDMSYDEAMERLYAQDYTFVKLVSILLTSGEFADDVKKNL